MICLGHGSLHSLSASSLYLHSSCKSGITRDRVPDGELVRDEETLLEGRIL